MVATLIVHYLAWSYLLNAIRTLAVGWGQVGGCLITIPFVRWQFLCWMLWFSGWMVVIPRTCTSCKMYGSSKFRPSDVSWDVLRGILAGSWQMGQTRHGFPWVPKSWVGHSSGMWGLHVSSNLKDVCLTTAGIVRWICVCSFSAVLLDLSTFKKEWSRLCLLPLFIKGRWRNEPKQLVISMLLYIQKSKTIGNLYTKKNEWFMKYLLQSFTYIHTPFCQFFPYEGSIFVFTVSRNKKSHPGGIFRPRKFKSQAMTPDSLAPQEGQIGFPDFGGGQFFSVWSTGVFFFGGAHANLRQMGLFSQF